MCLAPSAIAQIDPDPNGIGVYFDSEATVVSATVPVDEIFALYLILTNPSAPGGVAGWELAFHYDYQNLFLLGYSFAGNGINICDPWPNICVGIPPPPLPWAETIVLMTLNFYVLTDACVEYTLTPVEYPSLPGQMIYNDGADPFNLIPLHPSSGNVELPVAALNCEGPPPIRVQETSWGQAKALYR
jgi:hypothetical protein